MSDPSDEPRVAWQNDEGKVEYITFAEYAERVKNARDRQQEEQRAHMHDFWAEINLLIDTPERANALMHLFDSLRSNPNAVQYYYGYLVAQAKMQHNICEACGVDHDKELNEAFQNELAKQAEKPTEIPGQQEFQFTGDTVVAEFHATQPTHPNPVIEAEANRQLMDEYQVAPIYEFSPDDATGPDDPRVVCLRCKQFYWVSLEDRILRPASEDGCPQCINKSKWG